jgi:IS30 family transposase
MIIQRPAVSALESFVRQMDKLPAFLRQSLACCRGCEMALLWGFGSDAQVGYPVCQSLQPLAMWQQRKRQWPVSLIYAEGNGFVRHQPREILCLCPIVQLMPRQTLGWKTILEAAKASALSISSIPWGNPWRIIGSEKTFPENNAVLDF